MTDTVMCYRKLCRSKGENHMKQKYGIVSLVITATAWVVGILCLIVVGMKSDSSEISSGIVNLFVSGAVVIPVALSLAAIVLGALCITKKQKYRALAVIGIILALPFVLWGVLWGINCMNGMSIEEGVKAYLEGFGKNL